MNADGFRSLAGRLRLSLDRRLSASNLLERLARIYGGSTALRLHRPFMPSLSPGTRVSFREALRLTDLAAEALIRVLDLRRGERVLVLTPEAGEALMLLASLVKAGGIAVLLPRLPEEGELDLVLRGGGIGKALVGSGFFRSLHPERLETLRERGGLRLLAVEAGDAAPGETSLEEASSQSSGFFIPYTLKPGSVVMLSPRRGADGRPLLVMTTSRALLHPTRVLAPIFPAAGGGRCLLLLPPDGPTFVAAAFLALSAGLCLDTVDASANPSGDIVDESACAVMTAPRELDHKAEVRPASDFTGRARFLVCTDETAFSFEDGKSPLPPAAVSPGDVAASRPGLLPGTFPPPGGLVLLEFISLHETAPFALFRLSASGKRIRLRTPFLPLPPNRVRLRADPVTGKRVVAAIRGPAVSPGWWNDLETSLRAWEKGWFHPDTAFPAVSLSG